MPGIVYLVGAGPGDPGLLTLRGAECLRRADVVLYDYLANERLLELAPRAEQICLGRHGAERIWTQPEISQRLVELAEAGKTVVRLKGGDPLVFARGAEELETLLAARIPFEVVPGITAAVAAGSYAGVPITHRDLASAVAFVTGQESPEKNAAEIDVAGLARFPGTLVVYMGVTTANAWCGALIRHGKSPQTPALVVRRCTLPNQETFRTTLADVPNLLEQHKIRPPVVVILGSVAGLASRYAWFDRRPLFGRSVLVTRPVEQADGLRIPLEDLGAEVLVQPAIAIEPPDDTAACDAALRDMPTYDYVVFSSSNGVRAVLNRLSAIGLDLRVFGRSRLAAIGPGTAAALETARLKADVIPDVYRAEDLARELAADAGGKRFLLVRASRGREVLAEQLEAAGGWIDQVVAYTSRDVPHAKPEIERRMQAGTLTWTTVTSSAIARSLARLFGDSLRRTRLASISPLTTSTLGELGFEATVEAREATMPSLVEAIAGHSDATP